MGIKYEVKDSPSSKIGIKVIDLINEKLKTGIPPTPENLSIAENIFYNLVDTFDYGCCDGCDNNGN